MDHFLLLHTRLRSILLKLVFVCCLVGLCQAFIFQAAAKAERAPNILVFIVDDMGYDDLGASGNTLVETPHLDSLAEQSARFTDFSVTPVCATTRASLLSGKYHWRVGVSHVHGGGDYLRRDELTIADRLKEAGYATGMWGKWHNGKSDGYLPWQRGFDEAYYGALYKHENAHGWKNGVFQQTDEWSPKLLSDFAVDFIERKRDVPFFALVSYLGVHEPLEAPRALIEERTEAGMGEHLATLYAMMEGIDTSVGAILKALDDSGVAEDTVVLFLSDNGPIRYNTSPIGAFPEKEWKQRNAYNELRGAKGQIWQNGIKSPLYVRWPGTVDPKEIGSLAHVTDLSPTLLALSGASAQEVLDVGYDGVSLLPLLKSSSAESAGDRMVFGGAWTLNAASSLGGFEPISRQNMDSYGFEEQRLYVRNERFKLLINPNGLSDEERAQNGGAFLVDLDEDPRERSNVIANHPEVATALKASLREWYEGFLDSDDLFHRPVFLIGMSEKGRSTVNLFGPSRIGGRAINTAHYLEGLGAPGDFAEWNIEVAQEGSYEVALTQLAETQPAMTLRLSIGDQVLEGHTGGGDAWEFGTVHLEEGAQSIRLEPVDTGSSGDTLRMLRHLVFYRSDMPRDETRYAW